MELPARVGEQPGEVAHALEVAHADGVPVEDDRPVVALATEDVAAPGRLGRSRAPARMRGGAASIPSRIARAARRSRSARCSLPRAAWASARPRRARAASYGAPTSFQSRTASDEGLAPRPPHRPRRAAPVRGRARRRRPAPCSRTGRRRAPARRRPIGRGRGRRPRSRSRPGRRAAAPAAGRCSAAAPSTARRRGRSSASRIEAAAVATSPWASRTSARPGWGSHPARCAASSASSAPATSPLCRRIRPSSVSGHPSSRRR